jgi:hypothetical protein
MQLLGRRSQTLGSRLRRTLLRSSGSNATCAVSQELKQRAGEQKASLPPSRQDLLLSLFAPTLHVVKDCDEDQSVRGRESGNVVVAELVASLLQAMVVELGDQA